MNNEVISVVFDRCCGLDIHKKLIVACLLIRDASGKLTKELRTFSTMTTGLLELLEWLKGV